MNRMKACVLKGINDIDGVLIRYCVQIESLFWGMLEADGIFLFKLSLYVINKSQV